MVVFLTRFVGVFLRVEERLLEVEGGLFCSFGFVRSSLTPFPSSTTPSFKKGLALCHRASQ